MITLQISGLSDEVVGVLEFSASKLVHFYATNNVIYFWLSEVIFES